MKKKYNINDVCIIDDDIIFVYGVKKMIELMVYNAIQFSVYKNGQEALDSLTESIHCNSKLPDVIFLDLNMPILDGWQFLDEFINVPVPSSKKIELYIVSSSVDPEDVLKAKSYDIVNNYIIKPISKDKVVEILNFLGSKPIAS